MKKATVFMVLLSLFTCFAGFDLNDPGCEIDHPGLPPAGQINMGNTGIGRLILRTGIVLIPSETTDSKEHPPKYLI